MSDAEVFDKFAERYYKEKTPLPTEKELNQMEAEYYAQTYPDEFEKFVAQSAKESYLDDEIKNTQAEKKNIQPSRKELNNL